VLLWNKALVKRVLVFGHSFNSRIFLDVVQRASALGSIQPEHSHGFMRCLAAKDSRGEVLTRVVILALLRLETQVRSCLGPQAGASRIRCPHDLTLLKPAAPADAKCFGEVV
jgi:hypothetical protein